MGIWVYSLTVYTGLHGTASNITQRQIYNFLKPVTILGSDSQILSRVRQ
jgi:hypothetical protein